MKSKYLWLFIASLFLSIIKAGAQDLKDANKILAKTDQTVFAVKDKSAIIEMRLMKLKKDKVKVKKAFLYQKGTDKKLFRYFYPKADSGVAVLSLPDNQVYLYLSLFTKAKKITNLAEKNSHNQSDFSFEEMVTKSYSAKYTPELIGVTDTSYVLKLIQKDSIKTYAYVLATINKKFFYPEKLEYFDDKGEKLKVATNHFTKVQNFWVADESTMTDLKKQHMTKIIMTDIKINTGLTDEIFTLKNLETKYKGI